MFNRHTVEDQVFGVIVFHGDGDVLQTGSGENCFDCDGNLAKCLTQRFGGTGDGIHRL